MSPMAEAGAFRNMDGWDWIWFGAMIGLWAVLAAILVMVAVVVRRRRRGG